MEFTHSLPEFEHRNFDGGKDLSFFVVHRENKPSFSRDDIRHAEEVLFAIAHDLFCEGYLSHNEHFRYEYWMLVSRPFLLIGIEHVWQLIGTEVELAAFMKSRKDDNVYAIGITLHHVERLI